MTAHITAALVGIGILGVLAQWLAWRVRQPAILFLLLAGLAVGPMLGWLDPDALLGDLLFPVISLAVAVILFEGGLTLRLDEIRGIEGPVNRLLTVGVLVTWGSTTVFTHYLIGVTWELAILFGAITIVTGPTVIVPLLRSVRPSQRVANILRWEGIVIDPIGALVAVLVFEFLVSSGAARSVGGALATFSIVLLVGTALGALAGFLLGLALRNDWLPEYLHNVATLVWVFTVFAGANALQHESGLLAVTVMGMWLANMRRVPLEGILDFKESLSVLLISGLFILLAARLDPATLQPLGWGALGLVVAMQFVGRPLNVAASTVGTALTWRERALLAWIAPRGIVAAAVSAVFALRLEEAGFAGAELLVPLTFLVILATVVLQSLTARPLASALGVRAPAPTGVLIIGANPVARALGEVLQSLEFPVMLADTRRSSVNEAHLAGLPAYYGNPVSEHADRHLELAGLGRLLALSPRDDLNTLACVHFAREFGIGGVYRLTPDDHDSLIPAAMRQRHRHDTLLFGDGVTYQRLAGALSRGDRLRATPLTERFDWQAYQEEHPAAIPLLAVDRAGRLRVFTAETRLDPEPGWTVIALVGNDRQGRAG